MKVFKRVLFTILGFVGLLLVLFVLFIALAQILEFQPKASLNLVDRNPAAVSAKQEPPRELSLFSWNIGYAGLDSGADFILEGGRLIRARSEAVVRENMAGILEVLQQHPADIYFLQEVDFKSNRSYNLNELEAVEEAFPAYGSWYGVNYKVFFVPFPPFAPLGAIHSGIVSLSRYPVSLARRLQLPGAYDWPVRLFHLKRCLLTIRIPSPVADIDWYLVQLHLSAYDSGGTLRKQQLNFISTYLQKLAGQGHYIVVGGDWNSLFPGTTRESFGPYSSTAENLFWVQPLPADWSLPGWTWVFQPGVPTCRSLEQPFEPGENFRCIIDGFLISPNLEAVSVETLELNFRHSDHNPVLLKVRMKS